MPIADPRRGSSVFGGSMVDVFVVGTGRWFSAKKGGKRLRNGTFDTHVFWMWPPLTV